MTKRVKPRPIENIGLVTFEHTCSILDCSRATLYRLEESTPDFPKRVPITGVRGVRYRRQDVMDLLDRLTGLSE